MYLRQLALDRARVVRGADLEHAPIILIPRHSGQFRAKTARSASWRRQGGGVTPRAATTVASVAATGTREAGGAAGGSSSSDVMSTNCEVEAPPRRLAAIPAASCCALRSSTERALDCAAPAHGPSPTASSRGRFAPGRCWTYSALSRSKSASNFAWFISRYCRLTRKWRPSRSAAHDGSGGSGGAPGRGSTGGSFSTRVRPWTTSLPLKMIRSPLYSTCVFSTQRAHGTPSSLSSRAVAHAEHCRFRSSWWRGSFMYWPSP